MTDFELMEMDRRADEAAREAKCTVEDYYGTDVKALVAEVRKLRGIINEAKTEALARDFRASTTEFHRLLAILAKADSAN